MKQIQYRDYTITFDPYPVDGFQFAVWLHEDGEILTLTNERMIGYTWFEALARFTAEYLDDEDATLAGILAANNDIPWGYAHDAVCEECGLGDYEENMDHSADYEEWWHVSCLKA